MPDISKVRIRKNGQAQLYDVRDDVARNGHFIGDIYANANQDYTGGNKLPTEDRVNSLIASAIGGISSFNTAVVQELPQIGNPSTIYFVRHPGGTDNIYDEYLWINSKWERIGSTDIDISGKADKVDTVLDTTLSMGRAANSTIGAKSTALGNNVTASGNNSQAFGASTLADGFAAHAEGSGTTASGHYSHAEGGSTTASGSWSHAEGGGSRAIENNAHAEGGGTLASGASSHSEGGRTIASGVASHAEGAITTASGSTSHAEGTGTIANHASQHVSGEYNVADPSLAEATERGTYVEIIGNGTNDNNCSNARTLDWDGNERIAGDLYVHANADGSGGSKLPDESRVNALIASAVSGITSFEVVIVQALPQAGNPNTIYFVPKQGSVEDVHDEYMYINDTWELIGTTQIDISGKADKTDTVLNTSLSRGRNSGTTPGMGSIAFGNNVEASGVFSQAEGTNTAATQIGAHAEGNNTQANGVFSHTEGTNAIANGANSHSQGLYTIANGHESFVYGRYNAPDIYSDWHEWVPGLYYVVGDKKKRTITVHDGNESVTTVTGYICNTANNDLEFIESKWDQDQLFTFAEIVGNGTAVDARSNARTLDWNGNERLAGDVYVHANSNGTGGSKLPDESRVNALIASAVSGITSFDVVVVQTLPQAGNPNTIYFVPKQGSGSDVHDEYMYINNTWELIGTTQIDISGKADKTDTVLNTTLSRGRKSNTTVGAGSFAFGGDVQASAVYSHAEGYYGRVNSNGYAAHSEGYGSATNFNYPQYNAPVDRTADFNGRTQAGTSISLPTGAHAQGAHNEGSLTTANNSSSHAEGYATAACADDSHAEGLGSIVTGGPASHAEGKFTYASGAGGAHAEGVYTTAQGGGGEHSEGMYTSASGSGGTHAEGYVTSVSGGNGSHAEGYYVYGNGTYGFHIEGDHTECACGNGAHTEGYYSKSFGRNGAHTEGDHTIGQGEGSHTGGRYNVPNNMNFLPEWEPNKLYHVGEQVKHTFINAGNELYDGYTCKIEHISGDTFESTNWQQEYTDNGYAEIIGNGTADNERANARALDWKGNEHLAGNLYVGCNPDSTGGTKVLTENDIEYTTEADALKIISDFWEEEEDDSVIAEMVLTSNGYAFESVLTANEIGALIESGKMVILHFPGEEGSVPDSYIPIASYAPAVEGSQNYPYPSFALCDIAQSSPYKNLVRELNYVNVDPITGKLNIPYAD